VSARLSTPRGRTASLSLSLSLSLTAWQSPGARLTAW
jgi:hypothetical protein